MTKVDLNFVEGLTLEERANLVSGTDFWFTAKVTGMDPMLMTDGPSGLRKQVNVHSAMVTRTPKVGNTTLGVFL